MRERFYIGILPIHGDSVVVQAKKKRDVKTAIEERIRDANKKFPDFDFHPGIRIYKGKRIK